jgi:hypothetical protein
MRKANRFAMAATALGLVVATGPITASAQPTKTYKNPDTGEDCVKETGSEQSSDNYVQINFRNSCNYTFSIYWKSPTASLHSTGISPYGTSHHTVRNDQLPGLEWWFE